MISSLLSRISLAPLRGSNLVLYFHRIGQQQSGFYPDGITSDSLRESIDFLLDAGFVFRSLSEAYSQTPSIGRLSAVLTCDDALASIYHEFLPILQEYGLPLTIFVIGACIDNRALAWNHKLIQIRRHASEKDLLSYLQSIRGRYGLQDLPELPQILFSVQDSKKDALCDKLWGAFCPQSQEDYLHDHQPFLSPSQMRELAENGAEFALHSQSHADFSRLSYARMLDELRQNREHLYEYGHKVAPFFAFPYGRECQPELLKKLCRDAGIKAALGIRHRISDNRRQTPLWQRYNLEQRQKPGFQSLVLGPALRLLKTP